MRRQTVYLYRVDLGFDLEKLVQGKIGIIYKGLARWAKPAMHGRQTITFVVISEETSSELQARMKPALEKVGGVENTWCFVAP